MHPGVTRIARHLAALAADKGNAHALAVDDAATIHVVLFQLQQHLKDDPAVLARLQLIGISTARLFKQQGVSMSEVEALGRLYLSADLSDEEYAQASAAASKPTQEAAQ